MVEESEMHGELPQTSRSITIRIPIELFEFMREESRKGHRSMNRQFGLLITKAMKKEKASGQLAGTPDASSK